MFDKLLGFLSGGLVKEAREAIRDYFPPSMSDKEKAELDFRIKTTLRESSLKASSLANQAIEGFNNRIKELEGTAKDLQSIPIVGRLIIFLRGCQRPIWGFGTLILDWKVFSSAWTLTSPKEQVAFVLINCLVLGFLFGERTLINLMPVIKMILEMILPRKNKT